VIARFWIWFFFERVEVRHPERVPRMGPVLLCINHPNNLIDSLLVGAILPRTKVLLTATPLQNTLLELFGLIGFLDEHLLGDISSFRAAYLRGPLTDSQFRDLRARLAPLCKRTLRRQVTEYVRYTRRIPITQDFTPTDEEQQLYDGVSAYLQRGRLHALPASQRKLMTLVLRRLLASSTFAIAGTLTSILGRLRSQAAQLGPPGLEEDFEAFPELAEEWTDDPDDTPGVPVDPAVQAAKAEIAGEIAELSAHQGLTASRACQGHWHQSSGAEGWCWSWYSSAREGGPSGMTGGGRAMYDHSATRLDRLNSPD